MKTTEVKMSEIKDGKPFDKAVWKEATPKQKDKVYSVMSKIKSYKNKYISLQNRGKFAEKEYVEHYHEVFKNRLDFFSVMFEDVKECNTCKKCYWDGCLKNCSCKD